MAHSISVLPHGDGWIVRSATFGTDMIFRSGAKAEAAARQLGRKLATHGHASEIRVFLRDGTLAGRFVCAGAPGDLPLAV